jgi:ABC-type multidrug transport system fused ATPase/permease subunit
MTMTEPDVSQLSDFTEQDLKTTFTRALRWVGILGVVGAIAILLAAGWQSAVLFLVGAAIAATGLYESQRLMLAVLSRFNEGQQAKPIAGVLIWFFLRLILAGVVLYVSLRGLEGSVYALCAGLGLAVVALTIESIRLLRAWTL